MRQLIRQLVRVEAVAVVVIAWVAGALLLGLATVAGAVPTAALMALGPLLGGLLLLIMHSLELARRIGNLSGESTRTLTTVRRVESDLYKVEREIKQTFRQLVMSVFGGMSKGERNRIKIRVRTAMAAQARIEGRFLGGRPPYGYRLIDASPHPNPAKAADGKRLHALASDPKTSDVVRRIFAEYIAGKGLKAIAERLTRDGVPSPSAYDPDRNRHR